MNESCLGGAQKPVGSPPALRCRSSVCLSPHSQPWPWSGAGVGGRVLVTNLFTLPCHTVYVIMGIEYSALFGYRHET